MQNNIYFQVITAVAAFGGLILGIINLFLSLYKDFWRKGKLESTIEFADIRSVEEGLFDFQMNLSIKAINSDVYIQEIKLLARNKVFGAFMNESDNIDIYRYLSYLNTELLTLDRNKFEEALKEKYQEAKYTRDTKISKDSQISITFADRIETTREMDGYTDLPLKGWKLYIKHSQGESTVDFDFTNKGKKDSYNYFS